MSFQKIPYDNAKVEAIRIRLENHSRIGEPISYAVTVDDLEVIPKTTDATLFQSVYDLIGPTTKWITISEYIGNTRNRNNTCFYFDGPKQLNGQTFHGIEEGPAASFEDRVQKQVEQVTLKQNHDKLQRDNQTLRQQLDTLLKRNDELEKQNGELIKLQDENSQTNVLLELGREALDRFLGPKPKDGPLSGTEEHEQNGERKAETGNANNEEPTHVAISEREYEEYKFFTGLFKGFDKVQRGLVSQLLTLLTEHPELIESTYMSAFEKSQDDGN